MLHDNRDGRVPLAQLVYSIEGAEPTRIRIPEPNIDLLIANRQVRDEVLDIGWSVMRKRFFDFNVFTAAVDARLGTAMNYSYLTTVELTFTNKQFFDFLGVRPERQLRIDTQASLGSYLQALPGIKDLQLRFRYLDEGYTSSSWGYQRDKLRLPRYSSYAYECCQRTIVDCICTFAFQTVTVTGKAKTESKEKWNAIFKSARDHDQANAMADILATPDTQL